MRSKISVLTTENKINNRLKQALDFCKENDFNQYFCILIDMSIHSGKNRLFVCDFSKNELVKSSLCVHGSGKDELKSTLSEPKFSNEVGSLLSSLGKYKIGIRSYSKWGIHVHYKLYGLETANSNALERIVVLHSYTPVPSQEIYPEYLPMGYSQGCPVVDDDTMKYLDEMLSNIKKPVLLWIYN